MDTTDLTLDEIRPLLVKAMLPHVAFDGWTSAAVASGAADAGIDPDIARLAFDSPGAMVDAYTALADARMTAAVEAAGIASMKVRDKITLCVRTRLEQAGDEAETVRRGLGVLAMPQNLPLAARTLWRTADTMWRAAGDTATDYNHYTKRLILGGVYSASLLYWLDDDSVGHAATWGFVDRRIAGVIRFETAKAKFTNRTGDGPSLVRFLGRLRYPAV